MDSEIGDATEIQDESLSKELNSTVEVQNDEVFSSHSENIDTQCVLEDKPTQENSENEVVSFQFSNFCKSNLTASSFLSFYCYQPLQCYKQYSMKKTVT